MTEIAQAYIHLRPYDIEPQNIPRVGNDATRIAKAAAKRIYRAEVVVEITFEEGSLIGRVTVIAWHLFAGGIALYSFISDYKGYEGFKEGIAHMCTDARDFGADVCAAIPNSMGASNKVIYRTERRLQVPGKIDRLLKKLELLEAGVDDLSPKQLRSGLQAAAKELKAIEADLSAPDMMVLRRNLKHFRKLGPPVDWPQKHADIPRVAVRRTSPPDRKFLYHNRIPIGVSEPVSEALKGLTGNSG